MWCGCERVPGAPAGVSAAANSRPMLAVFEHRDHISAIAGTWKAIWEHRPADSGLQALDGPALERYDEKFDGRTGLGGLEIWIPVKA